MWQAFVLLCLISRGDTTDCAETKTESNKQGGTGLDGLTLCRPRIL